jgi:hypothetical protein
MIGEDAPCSDVVIGLQISEDPMNISEDKKLRQGYTPSRFKRMNCKKASELEVAEEMDAIDENEHELSSKSNLSDSGFGDSPEKICSKPIISSNNFLQAPDVPVKTF